MYYFCSNNFGGKLKQQITEAALAFGVAAFLAAATITFNESWMFVAARICMGLCALCSVIAGISFLRGK